MTSETDAGEGTSGTEIGFITVRELSPRCYRAGLLVTDHSGKPSELRVTDPVRPDRVQVVLYGESLVPVIAQELCGRPLIDALRQTPELIVADIDIFLPLHTAALPVVHVRSGEQLEVDGGDGTGERLESASTKFEPIILGFDSRATPDDRARIGHRLRTVFEALDPLEPFERIAKALKILHDQEERGQA